MKPFLSLNTSWPLKQDFIIFLLLTTLVPSKVLLNDRFNVSCSQLKKISSFLSVGIFFLYQIDAFFPSEIQIRVNYFQLCPVQVAAYRGG